jgi:hypothetical protein
MDIADLCKKNYTKLKKIIDFIVIGVYYAGRFKKLWFGNLPGRQEAGMAGKNKKIADTCSGQELSNCSKKLFTAIIAPSMSPTDRFNQLIYQDNSITLVLCCRNFFFSLNDEQPPRNAFVIKSLAKGGALC